MSINRNLVINYLLVCAVVIISLFLSTSCSKSEMKRENDSVSDDISEPTVPIHEPTLPFEQFATEDETTIEVTTTAEPTTQPTTEATTTKPTEKTTEKTTAKTTQKTTAKTQKTKSTTTEKPKTSQTTAEDVPLPEPEAIAERLEKLTPELRDWVANAQPEEIIDVYLWCEGLSDDYIDDLVYAEYGFEPEEQDDDVIDVEGPAEERTPAENEQAQKEHEYIDALIKARRTILKREYTKLNEEFIANYIPKERRVIYYGDYTSTITVEATAEEILFYSSLSQVEEISSDFGLGEPESSVDVEDPTTSD